MKVSQMTTINAQKKTPGIGTLRGLGEESVSPIGTRQVSVKIRNSSDTGCINCTQLFLKPTTKILFYQINQIITLSLIGGLGWRHMCHRTRRRENDSCYIKDTASTYEISARLSPGKKQCRR
jgi:hypothetical protein